MTAPKVITVEKERKRRGQGVYRQRLAPGAPKPKTATAIYERSQNLRWRRIKVSEGGTWPRVYEFARLRAIEVQERLPSKSKWVVFRRNLDQSEVKYFISNAPQEVPLKEMAKVASSRWPVEISFEEDKQEVGLDEYEVRSWQAWHHHIARSMLALAFLAFARKRLGKKTIEMTVPEARRILQWLLPRRKWSMDEIFYRSEWRRRRNRIARRCHYRRCLKALSRFL